MPRIVCGGKLLCLFPTLENSIFPRPTFPGVPLISMAVMQTMEGAVHARILAKPLISGQDKQDLQDGGLGHPIRAGWASFNALVNLSPQSTQTRSRVPVLV